MPIGGKDAFLSKVTFRRESKWYSKTKQELKDMKTIEERAEQYAWSVWPNPMFAQEWEECKENYIAGATEQKAIDEAKLLKLKSAWEKQAQINHDDEANYQQGFHDAIEQACEWLGVHLAEVADRYDSTADLMLRHLRENFRKAMEK